MTPEQQVEMKKALDDIQMLTRHLAQLTLTVQTLNFEVHRLNEKECERYVPESPR